jgi:hypothetical protein
MTSYQPESNRANSGARRSASGPQGDGLEMGRTRTANRAQRFIAASQARTTAARRRFSGPFHGQGKAVEVVVRLLRCCAADYSSPAGIRQDMKCQFTKRAEL